MILSLINCHGVALHKAFSVLFYVCACMLWNKSCRKQRRKKATEKHN